MRISDEFGWPERRRRRIGIRPQTSAELNIDTVPFVPFACPQCGGKPRTYGVDRDQRVRYHRCEPCGYQYRSIEVAADQVHGFEGDHDSDRAPRGSSR